jgi:LmbE family N-acetylglucosaminyl deacetylase
LHQLNYVDSGMEGAPENKDPASLYQAELDQVAREVVRLIRQVRPHVVLTHNPTGDYFHPDHIKTNHAVQRGFPRAAEAQTYPTLTAEGYQPWQPDRLFYMVMPRSRMRWWNLLLRLQGKDPSRFGQNEDIDLTKLGVPDHKVDVKLDVRPYLSIKEAASQCHETQQGRGGPGSMLPGFLRRWIMRHEHFMQAYPSDTGKHQDLFEGLDTSRQ